MDEGKLYWAISAPKTKEGTFDGASSRLREAQAGKVYKFSMPDLKVGTLDSLMALSDELVKIDAFVLGVAKKVAQQRFAAWEAEDGAAADARYKITVNSKSVDDYLASFQWDQSKYPSTHRLKALVSLINSQVVKLDEELKVKTADFQQVMAAIQQQERGRSGNMMQRDLSGLIKKKHVTQTDYLTTLFVVVRAADEKIWLADYEKITDFVLPRSSKKIAGDAENCLYSVVLFKRVVDDFTNNAREKKFIVREFKFQEDATSGKDEKELSAEKERQKGNLMRFCNVNFSEAFSAWVHLVAIRVFVESVLRYGLPTNFQAMLVLPSKGKDRKARALLEQLYAHLGDANMLGAETEENGADGETFYPYVSVDMQVEMRSGSLDF